MYVINLRDLQESKEQMTSLEKGMDETIQKLEEWVK